MQITPDQLRYLREQRGFTREELARELDCSAGAIVQWERSTRAIPSWVAEKMWRNLPVSFTVDELNELMQLARDTDVSFFTLLNQAARLVIENHRNVKKRPNDKSAGGIKETASCADDAPSTSPIPTHPSAPATAKIVKLPPPPVLGTILHDSLKETQVAETAAPSSHDLPKRQETVYRSKKRK